MEMAFVEKEFVLPTQVPFRYGATVTAGDRRACVRYLFGSWFDDQKLKLTRDYMVTFGNRSLQGTFGYEHFARIAIRDKSKAVLFKLTWC